MEWFEGNFEAYEEGKRRGSGPEANLPHPTTHKKLKSLLDGVILKLNISDSMDAYKVCTLASVEACSMVVVHAIKLLASDIIVHVGGSSTFSAVRIRE